MTNTPSTSDLYSTKRTVKFFEGLLRSTPNGIVVTDPSQNIMVANEKFGSLFQQHWRAVIETNLFVWLQQLEDDAVDLWAKLIEMVYRDRYCYDIQFSRTTNEGTRYMSVNASLVEQVSQEDQGIIISVWVDITKQRQMEEQIIATERLALLGRLSSSIAHEIRNPLATIDISAQNLKRKYKDADEKTRSQIDRILKQVKETTETIQSLQDLATLVAPDKKRHDISGVIEDGISTSEIPASVRIVKTDTKGELFIDMDWKQISMVLRNILSNAVQAMKNSGTIWVTVYKTGDDSINISIKDSGPGIAAENLKKIFQPFFGTRTQGFGYGLTMCTEVMGKHGGTLDVQSKEGEGTTFILSFPSVDAENR
ncbi:MAG: PAS domain S-box protein [Planctomycetes bacterium]|nr:PAS domain S-box protein [Planctomycetota bacterium]